MTSEKNWRTEVDAGDYFLQQKKSAQIADRRPVIRRPEDLVGPGIAGQATRIIDFNSVIATYNGYYSAAAGAANAPTITEPFIGQVVSDSELGGEQVFRGLSTGYEYYRTFSRGSIDPSFITWSPWVYQGVQPSAFSTNKPNTTLTNGTTTDINMPTIGQQGPTGYYSSSGTVFSVLKPGTYTGNIVLSLDDSGYNLIYYPITLSTPSGSGTRSITSYRQRVAGVWMPFAFSTTVGTQGIKVTVASVGDPDPFHTAVVQNFSISRLGEP